MADYAANFTARYRIRYSSAGYAHTMMFRAVHGDASPAVGLVNAASSFLTALAPFMHADWSVVSAEYAARNSDVFLPVATPANPTGKSLVPSTKGGVPAFVGFSGRTGGGSKVRLYVYGLVLRPDTDGGMDYRFSQGESADLATAIANLANSSILAGVDGLTAVWRQYVNLGYNSHWQRALRG